MVACKNAEKVQVGRCVLREENETLLSRVEMAARFLLAGIIMFVAFISFIAFYVVVLIWGELVKVGQFF